MENKILLLKLFIAFSASTLIFLILRQRNLQVWLTGKSWTIISTVFVSQRLLIFFALYLGLGLSLQSDLTVYLAEAKLTLAGKKPFIDFQTAYGPWFPFTLALALRIWKSGPALVLLSVLFEFVAWPFWLNLFQTLLGKRTAKLAAWLYILAPLAILNVPAVGLNHIWISAFLAVALYGEMRGWQWLAGLSLGASIVVVKFLSLLFVPALWWGSRRRIAWLAGFVVLPVIAYAPLLLKHVDLLSQVKFHAHYDSSGSIPYLAGILGIDPSAPLIRNTFNLIGLLVLASTFFLCARRGRFGTIQKKAFAMPFFLLIMLLVSKKSFSSYLEIALFPLAALTALEADRVKTLFWFSAVMFTTSIEPSLWFRLIHQRELNQMWSSPAPTSGWQLASFVLLEVFMLAGYIFLALRLYSAMSETSNGPGTSGTLEDSNRCLARGEQAQNLTFDP